MPKVTESIMEQSISPVMDAVVSTHQKLTVRTEPVLTVAVGRKINTGNFENVDVMVCLTVGMGEIDPKNTEAFSQAVKDTAAQVFSLASRETADRYNAVKEAQQGR
jgi:hypothetical protein